MQASRICLGPPWPCSLPRPGSWDLSLFNSFYPHSVPSHLCGDSWASLCTLCVPICVSTARASALGPPLQLHSFCPGLPSTCTDFTAMTGPGQISEFSPSLCSPFLEVRWPFPHLLLLLNPWPLPSTPPRTPSTRLLLFLRRHLSSMWHVTPASPVECTLLLASMR